MKIINLEEARLASKIVKDFPEALIKLDKCRQTLYTHSEYVDVALVIKQINESIIMMDILLQVYSKVLKGIKDGEQN